jgi:hypothetical protein
LRTDYIAITTIVIFLYGAGVIVYQKFRSRQSATLMESILVKAERIITQEKEMLTIDQVEEAVEEMDQFLHAHEIALKEWDEAFEKADY